MVKPAQENKDQEIQITKAQVLRAIEQLKASDYEVNPATVARTMGISKTIFYSNLELLDSIYRYGSHPSGPDIVIQELVVQLRSAKRKVEKQKKQLLDAEINVKKSYSDGFSEGAALNFNSNEEETESSRSEYASLLSRVEDDWAMGVLYIDPATVLTEEAIKSAYRQLVQILHPDKINQANHELIHTLNKAYEILLEKYSNN